MIRIAFIIRSLGVGGAERQLTVLAIALAARGHAVEVITYYGGGVRHEELDRAGVVVVSLEKRSRWDLVGPLLRLRRAVRAFRPDVIHGYLPDGNLLALLASRLSYRAVVVWGVRSSAYDFRIYDWLFRAVFWASCRLAGRADLIIANSEAGRAYHLSMGYPAARTIVIPNGVDTARFHRDVECRARQRAAWGIDEGAPLIGIVGRLDPMKDHPTFFRAAAEFARRVPTARFACIGDGPVEYRETLQTLARSLGIAERTRWVAASPDLLAAYNALDRLVSVSTSGEGFPNVIGEAMACGVRCAVTDVGDSLRVVGDTGLALAVGDPDAIAASLEADWTLIGEGSRLEPRERIETEYSVAQLVRRTEEGLATALGTVGRASA